MGWATSAILLLALLTGTSRSPSTRTTRPLVAPLPSRYGISLAHNGNLINCDELRGKLLCDLRCINTSSVSVFPRLDLRIAS